jgi:molecular chaperone DnaK (HSP70)
MVSKKVGIDWGTSKCCISTTDNNNDVHLLTDNDEYLISTIIGIQINNNNHNKNILVGNQIKKSINYGMPIITSLKRLIGIDITSEISIKIASYYNWTLKYDNNINDIIIKIDELEYYLNDLIIKIMKHLYEIIRNNIGDNFNSCITVPAHFNDFQRRYIMNCATAANLNCEQILNEPVSAALSYLVKCYRPNSDLDEINLIIFDFGAGTLDLAAVNGTYENNKWVVEVLGTNGDNQLGGIDINNILIDWLKDKYYEIYELLIRKKENINDLIENLKITISNEEDEYTSIIYNIMGYDIIISVYEYHKLLNDNFSSRIINLFNDLLKLVNLNNDDLYGVLLVGGSSKNKWILNILKNLNINIIHQTEINVYIDDKIKKINFADVGISIGATDIKYNTEDNSLLLIDTVPLSLGIEQIGGKMSKIIKKNSVIPVSITKSYTVADINDTEIDIKVYQGERDLCVNNFFIGNFKLSNIKNVSEYNRPRIQVTISINKNNIINVIAKEWRSDNESKLTILSEKIKLPLNIIEENITTYEKIDTKENLIITNFYEILTYINRIIFNLYENINNSLPNADILVYSDNLLYIMSKFYIDIMNYKDISIDKLNIVIDYLFNKYDSLKEKYQNKFKICNDSIINNDNLLIKLVNISKEINDTFGVLLNFYVKETINENKNNKYTHLNGDINDNFKGTYILEKEKEKEEKLNIELEYLNKEEYLEKELNELITSLMSNINSFNLNSEKQEKLITFLYTVNDTYNITKSSKTITNNIIIDFINSINTFCDNL